MLWVWLWWRNFEAVGSGSNPLLIISCDHDTLTGFSLGPDGCFNSIGCFKFTADVANVGTCFFRPGRHNLHKNVRFFPLESVLICTPATFHMKWISAVQVAGSATWTSSADMPDKIEAQQPLASISHHPWPNSTNSRFLIKEMQVLIYISTPHFMCCWHNNRDTSRM